MLQRYGASAASARARRAYLAGRSPVDQLGRKTWTQTATTSASSCPIRRAGEPTAASAAPQRPSTPSAHDT